MERKQCARCGEMIELCLTDAISIHVKCKCASEDYRDTVIARGLSTTHLPKSEGDILRK